MTFPRTLAAANGNRGRKIYVRNGASDEIEIQAYVIYPCISCIDHVLSRRGDTGMRARPTISMHCRRFSFETSAGPAYRVERKRTKRSVRTGERGGNLRKRTEDNQRPRNPVSSVIRLKRKTRN